MKSKFKGILLAVIATVLWGLSGNAVEYVLKNTNINSLIYVKYRMLHCAIILFVYYLIKYDKKYLFDIFKYDLKKLLFYSFFGLIGLQIAFSLTIEYSNAAFATIIQYLSPLLIIIFSAFKIKKCPKNKEIILIILAIISMFLMLSNGNISIIKVNLFPIFTGLLSAITFSIYIVYMKKLFKYPGILVISIASFIGYALLIPFTESINLLNYPNKIILIYLFIILFGTIIPFYLFIESTRYIKPKITSILSAIEPITAYLFSILLFNYKISILQIISMISLIILVSVITQIKEK